MIKLRKRYLSHDFAFLFKCLLSQIFFKTYVIHLNYFFIQ